MYPDHPLSEYFDFTYSKFGKPEIAGTAIKVPVYEFTVNKGFPGIQTATLYEHGILKFNGVVSSVRIIREFDDATQGSFKLPVTEEYQNITEGNEQSGNFYLGGFSSDPPGWVEWNIVAGSVQLEGGKIKKTFSNQ